jgi:hypothetical protein
MDFVKMQQLQHEEDEEFYDQEYEEKPKKRKQRRSKTTGDEPSNTPQFHTQTITQLDWSFNSAPEEEDRSIFGVPSSSQSAKLPKNARKLPAKAEPAIPPPPQESPIQDTPLPQTPYRNLAREIPSSQSPSTPVSLNSRDSMTRSSPLKNLSINTSTLFNTYNKSQGSPFKRRKLEIEERSEIGTHASQLNHIPSSPSKRSSPPKSVRFALPRVVEFSSGIYPLKNKEEDETAALFIKLESTPYPASQASAGTSSRVEILDSDAESEEYEEYCAELPASTSQVGEEEIAEQAVEKDMELQEATIQEDEGQQAETESCYGEIGAKTQMEAERILDSSRLSGITTATQARGDSTLGTFQNKTQMMESQRLATQHMDMMAPRTANSDIFISIHPQHVTNIVNRAKNHEMRTWSIPPTVCRVWIYETKPVSALKYMAEIGPARPGKCRIQCEERFMLDCI